MTNNLIILATDAPLWGTGSEWFWAFLSFLVAVFSFLVILKTFPLIAKQVGIQADQKKIEAASAVAETMCTMQERWNSDTMQRMRQKICMNWKGNNKEFDGVCEYVAEFMEELATFVEIGAISEKVMWDIQSWNVECYWQIFRDDIIKLRSEYKEDGFYEGFENLYNKIQTINSKKSVPTKNDVDIDDFIDREISSTTAALDIKKEIK